MELPKGCQYCIRGEKLVLFITGLCNQNCYYCPLSEKRKGKDVIYANERQITSIEEVIEEAYLCSSKGVGITGGNPLLRIDRTCEYLKALKDEFGEKFHAHLYTTPDLIDKEKLEKLQDAGLDEIRLHPTKIFNEGANTEYYKLLLDKLKLCMEYIEDVGVEIPSIPNMEKEILNLAYKLDEIGVKFLNINELEFSETTYDTLIAKGFEVKDDISSAIKGSEETALYVSENFKGNMIINYCPSSLKDNIQLRNRLINRAKNVAKDYEVITDEGLLLRGIMIFDNKEDLEEIAEILRDNEVEFEIVENKIYLNPFVLEDLIEEMKRARYEIKFSAYISEVYPTVDALEVERIPLVTKKLKFRRRK
ncbi:radical SAM protein [Methanotorris formicicus]|uniref:Radical SAM domain protein n=1 Tax=Methanotorris formicicus Mc-S-70 TaxID=647171 RepID=H1L144_9EURY|nr:radical SAM protein [Methanotorris formicicus]EHP84058.1 Radical SAM domain protein [Methanotorris formicicus Mc-S-70]